MQKIRILIIENDEDEQFFMRKGFLNSGLFDITAMLYSGVELFKELKDAVVRPDVILSDLNMYGMNGYEILAELKASVDFARIPVIITSNIAEPATVEKCKKLGALKLKEKPDNFAHYDKFAKDLYEELADVLNINPST